MAIPVMNYAAIPAQGDPMLDAIMPGLMQGMMAANAPKQMKADLKATELANQLAQIQMKYADPMAQSNLAKSQAQTNLINSQTKYMPLEELISAQNSMRANSRFGNAYQLSKMLSGLSPAARAAWIADNQDAYNQSLNDIANGANDPVQGNINNQIQELVMKLAGGQGQRVQQNQGQQQAVQNAPPLNFPTPPAQAFNLNAPMPSQEQLANSPYTISDQQAIKLGAKPVYGSDNHSSERMKLAEQMAANNSLITANARKQGESAVNMDRFLQENQADYSQAMKSISQYAGLIGKGNLGLDKLKSENPQALQDYLWFTSIFVPNMENMLTQMEGSSISPTKQKEIKGILDSGIKSLYTDPKSAVNYFNQTINMLSEISKQRKNTAQPLFKNTFNEAYGKSEIKKPYIKSGNNSSSVGTQPSKTITMNIGGKNITGTPEQFENFFKDHPELKGGK